MCLGVAFILLGDGLKLQSMVEACMYQLKVEVFSPNIKHRSSQFFISAPSTSLSELSKL
jgi:hypothetical protein